MFKSYHIQILMLKSYKSIEMGWIGWTSERQYARMNENVTLTWEENIKWTWQAQLDQNALLALRTKSGKSWKQVVGQKKN